MIGPGTRLGPYEILAPLGAGGMGEVWRARDTTLDREVALKFLPASVANDAERLARFDREAKVLASLNHPSIAAIYGFHDEGGQRFLAMELVPGVDLAERLRAGRLPAAEAIDVALQIAEALEAAHERGIVHRDLKPANVKITPEGKVKVLDFGLAKALDARPDASRDASMSPTITSLGTVAGIILGTAAYMSPEAARGRTVDKRADVWAFGCVLYEMLTGRLAFPGETVSDTMAAVLTREPDWTALPAGTQTHVKGLIARCLVKDSKERLRDIGDGRIALEEAPTRAEPVVVSKRPPIWIYGALAAAVAVSIGAGIFAGRKTADTRPPVFRPLTVGNGIVQSARFTSDGGTVVYGGAFDGRPLSLFSMRADGLESRPIDLPSADIAGISRDSKMALLLGRHYTGSWLRSGTLAQVALTGGTPRELLENVFDADISPDGSQFAVVVGDGGDQVLQYPIGKDVFRSHGWIGQPRIAPDGRRVAFVDHRIWGDDLGEIKLFDLDGKVRSLGTPEQQYTQGCAWAPDGKTVWYSNTDDFAGGQILAVEPGRPPRLVMRTPGIVRLQDVASDGRVLIVTDDTWITLVGELAGDTSERVYSLWSNDTAAGISADGSSYAGSDNVVIDGDYTVFFRRGAAPPVRLGPGLTVGMTPDAKWVLATTTLKATRGLTLLPVGAGQPRQLDLHGVIYSGFAGQYLQFSSDGKRFAFVGSKGTEGRAAYVLDLGDGLPRKVSREGATGAAISLDGAKVAVADPARGMYVVSSAGEVPVPGASKEEVPLGWTADSAAVLSWDKTLPPRIIKTDLASGRRELFRELRPVDPVGTAYGWLLVSPDGKYYLQRCRRMRSAVVLVTLHG